MSTIEIFPLNAYTWCLVIMVIMWCYIYDINSKPTYAAQFMVATHHGDPDEQRAARSLISIIKNVSQHGLEVPAFVRSIIISNTRTSQCQKTYILIHNDPTTFYDNDAIDYFQTMIILQFTAFANSHLTGTIERRLEPTGIDAASLITIFNAYKYLSAAAGALGIDELSDYTQNKTYDPEIHIAPINAYVRMYYDQIATELTHLHVNYATIPN